MPLRLYWNPHVVPLPGAVGAPLAFHRRLPGYAETPLRELPGLAADLGVGRLWIKDESRRLGLPSFKILGASWATYRALERRLGGLPPWNSLAELRAHLSPLRPLALAAATDGNHGRAVARMAALLGLEARIFVPTGTAAARIEAIQGEGAQVTVVDGTYDEAVALAAREAGPRCMVISDTSWEGYEEVPREVIAGYGTIFAEADAQLAALGEPRPDLIAVQIGVGALAAAVVQHYRGLGEHPQPLRIIGVEPLGAACALASMEAGRIVEVPGPHTSIMAGLNCGQPSPLAWPAVSRGVDLFMAVEDDAARRAMRALAAEGVTAGETGAAGVAGLLELLA
ncbi:MAG TPA: diaminopropionate ammonia-lyase, partial [Roseiflexaceae bacterium]|nr:diaminopropionate ammonia-lyase [Roseiflexaceae bacterium]